MKLLNRKNIYIIHHFQPMKKLAIPAKFLCIATLIGSMAACSGSDKPEAATAAPAATNGAAPATLNIRYIDSDSVTAHYILAQEFQELTLSALSKMESIKQARGSEIQKLMQQIDQKGRNNGYLSQESYEADMANLAKKQQDAENVLGNMQQRAQQEMAQRQIELNDSLESFIKDYNATHGYDAILFKAAGVYFNPALDITDEVIKGLNERYEKSKKSK